MNVSNHNKLETMHSMLERGGLLYADCIQEETSTPSAKADMPCAATSPQNGALKSGRQHTALHLTGPQ